MRWYERFGIEPPFPWVGIVAAGTALGAIAGVGIVYAALCFGGDHIVSF